MEAMLKRGHTAVEPLDTVRYMMEQSGIGPVDLSRRLGRGKTYISSTLYNRRSPKAETLARIAHECGYRLFLRSGDGDEIEVMSEQDNERKLRRALEGQSKEKDPSVDAQATEMRPSVDEVIRAYREGRIRIEGIGGDGG